MSPSESGTLKWTSNTPVSQSSLLCSHCTCFFVPLQDPRAVRWCQPKTSHQRVLKNSFFGFKVLTKRSHDAGLGRPETS